MFLPVPSISLAKFSLRKEKERRLSGQLLDPQMTSERLIAAANVPKVIDLERAPHPRNSGGRQCRLRRRPVLMRASRRRVASGISPINRLIPGLNPQSPRDVRANCGR